jgi:hypothetical protein
MNSSGYSIDNFHNGDTIVNGTLTVQDQIFVGDAEGQSEYLDSGNYTPTITSLTAGWSFDQKSATTRPAWYVKNGNIVSIGINMFASWVAPTTTVASFRITVPSEDIFEQKLTNQARSTASILGRYTVATTNKSALLEDSYEVVFNAVDFFTISSNTTFQLLMTYKLEGEDKPATAIISGGGGSGGDVRNPMIENLDGGGFSITNVDNLTAVSITAPNVVTNPLSVALDVNGLGLINCSAITGVASEVKFGGNTLSDVSQVVSSSNLTLSSPATATLAGLGGDITVHSGVIDINASSTINLISTGGLIESTSSDLRVQSTGGLLDIPSTGQAILEGLTQLTLLTPLLNVSATNTLVNGTLNMQNNTITNCTQISANDIKVESILSTYTM